MKYLERTAGAIVAVLVVIVLAQPALAERVEFSAIDTDGDNLLTKDEILSYMWEIGGERRGRRTEG